MGRKTSFDIVLYVDGLPLEWDWFETAALGGSETSGLSLAKEFASRGHKVTLFCRCENEGVQPDGVEYKKIGSTRESYDYFQNYISLVPNDILILQRIPEMLNLQTQTKIHILWMHDLAWYNRLNGFRSVLWNIDKVISGSDFATEQTLSVYGGNRDLYKTIPLAIEQKYWDESELKALNHEPKHVLFCSRPERGMDTLVYSIMPELIKQVPDVVLHVCGYSLNTGPMKDFYDHCYRGLAALGKNAVNHGTLTKKELYSLTKQMDAYVYPSDFEETFCITAIEAQRSGVPFITTKDQGALKNTLHPSANIFVEGNPKTKEYQEDFIKKTAAYLNQPESAKKTRRQKLTTWAKEYTWSRTAGLWEETIEDIFKYKTRNQFTIARHFFKENDILAAKKYANKVEDKESIDRIKEKYSFLDGVEDYTEFYNDYDFDPEILKQCSKNIESCARIETLVQYVTKHKDITDVLDYGCGEGAGSFPIANIRKDIQLHGFDVAESKIAISVDMVQERSKYNNVGFTAIPFDVDQFVAERVKIGEKGLYNCLVISEVLEHIPDPGKLLDSLEILLAPGAHVIITTPYGPFETEGDLYGPERRSHLSNFDRHDYRELLGNKKSLNVGFFFAEVDKNNSDRRLAHAFTTYRTNNNPCGTIDYDRKFKYVAPRESVSVCIIGKNNEDTIGACVKSVLPIADQIIFMDTGCTDGTLEILKKFPLVEVHKGSNPIEHGFETPRNEALHYVNGDWVFWIDTDETLIKSNRFHKYLRNNTFNGYAVNQHHFSCEPPNAFPPDLPVRFFRADKGIKFYGMIHEHPEEEMNKGIPVSVVLGDIHIAHPSYLSEDIRRKRFLRNFPLLQRDRVKYPHRILGQFFWLRDLIHRVRYILEQTGGRMTPEGVQMCREAVKITQEQFIPNFSQQHIYVEAMKYYSDACTYLGIGFEMILSLGTDRQAAKPQVQHKMRFGAIADYKAFMEHITAQSVERYEGKYK